MTEYFIYADNGSKICKRTEDEYGNLILETTRGTVSFENFQKQVLNPYYAKVHRGKRRRANNPAIQP